MSEAGASQAVRALPTQRQGAGYDRVPPHNLDAETSVLGAMLLSRDAIAEVSELIGPEDFYRGANRTLFEAARDLYDRGEPVDPVTLADELERRGQLEGVGGAVGIADLLAQVPTAANATYYARIVAEQALRRRLIDAGTQITRFGYDAEGAEEAVDSAEALVYQVAQRRYASEFTPMKELLTSSFELIERLHESNSAITGLATGFHDFDELTAGLQPANLVILAARPAMGKCLAASSTVLDPATGARRTIAEVVEAGQRGAAVDVAALRRDLRLEVAQPSAFHDNGVRPVVRLRTRLGREVVATANHPLLTPEGWLPLAMLAPGSRIATPRSLPFFGTDRLEDEDVALLACLVGEAAPVPECVFRLPREQVAAFLNRLLAGARVDEEGGAEQITYETRSNRLARDVCHLLLRFGIPAAVGRGAVNTSGALVWEVRISGAEAITALDARIGISGREATLAGMGRPAGARPIAGVAASSRGRPPARPDARRLPASPAVPGGADAGEASGDASDVFWDEVVSVEPAGAERVYDLTVPGSHNFVADDVIVHNSTLVTNMATNVAVELRKPVVMFSLEMSKMELVQRILAGEGRVDSERLRTGRLQETDWPKLSRAMGRLAEAPLFIDDTPGINLMEIRSKCRRLKQKHGLDLVIVDYLQLMQAHRRSENRVQEVSDLSRGLKILAKELDVPVLALSQLSRRPEDRTDRRPQLSDLRESGAIEQDADIVAFIYRDEVYDPESAAKGEAELIVAKHRNGPLKTIRLSFIGHHSRFASMARAPGSGAGSAPM